MTWNRISWLLPMFLAFAPSGRGAGVTVITHGHLGNATEWVLPMANAIANAGSLGLPPASTPCYQVTVVSTAGGFTVTQGLVSGPQPTNSSTGEILIKLDWSDIANDLISDSTVDIAAAVVPRLLQTNFITGLGGRALASMPIHLIGHSRGGSMVSEMARLLGRRGVWVDQLTLLDPHPANNDGFSDPLLPFVTDAPARVYENVLFADNYWETVNAYPNGKAVAGAYNRFLSRFDGGYSSAHSDVHLWYHATIDWRTPVSDTQATLGATERQTWWTIGESNGVNAGYVYSRLAGGPRLSESQPAGPGTDRIADGFNRRWNLGLAGVNNRSALGTISDPWPSVIQTRRVRSDRLAAGEPLAVEAWFQHARPVTSNVVLRLALDRDTNPFNGFEALLGETAVPATTATNIAATGLAFATPAGLSPGRYRWFVSISESGRTRFLYDAGAIEVMAPEDPIRLAIDLSESIRISVFSPAGKTCVLERSDDLAVWHGVTTNTAATSPWFFNEAVTDTGSGYYYRAHLRE